MPSKEVCGEGNRTPLQYSCLENPMGGGAWWPAVHGVAKSRARLSDFTSTFMHWRRKWQPTPVFFPGESQGQRSLVGCRLWGCTDSDMTEATWQQQQQQRYLYPWTSFLLLTLCVYSVAQSCPTHCDPLDCSPPGSSVHGVFQARILEWVVFSFSMGSSQPRGRTHVTPSPALAIRFFTAAPPGKLSLLTLFPHLHVLSHSYLTWKPFSLRTHTFPALWQIIPYT